MLNGRQEATGVVIAAERILSSGCGAGGVETEEGVKVTVAAEIDGEVAGDWRYEEVVLVGRGEGTGVYTARGGGEAG